LQSKKSVKRCNGCHLLGCVFAARGHGISHCAMYYNRCQLCKGINVIIQADAVWLQMQGKRAKIAVKISMHKAVVKPDSIKL